MKMNRNTFSFLFSFLGFSLANILISLCAITALSAYSDTGNLDRVGEACQSDACQTQGRTETALR
jgi:hypothetical protein